MNSYVQIALDAADYIQEGMAPEQAWEKASCRVFPKGSPAQKKGCPKNAFLGLFGVNVHSINAKHALDAKAYLLSHPGSPISPKELWDIVLNGNNKTYNGQMDVVLALFHKGLIP